MLSAFRFPDVAVGVVEQRDEVAIPPHDHVAAATTIATIRAAHGDVLLPTERGLARTAGAGFNVHEYAIDEHVSLDGRGGATCPARAPRVPHSARDHPGRAGR